MNKWQKGILGNRIEEDEKILKRLKKSYKEAEKEIDDKIAALLGRTDTENLQSIIYQIDYQKALKKQINGILDSLNAKQFSDISDYLTRCYEDGFVGVMYDLHGQGIPMIIPIDQEEVVRSLKNNMKLSKGLWGSLYDRNSALQNKVRSAMSSGISQGKSYADISKSVSSQMGIGYNNIARIVRTESHRISNEATLDAQYKAKDKGADIVKQWDATLDKLTRPYHARLDGQIREINDPFEVAGEKVMYPGGFGIASEDINCRCAILQRAKWALDDEELQMLKERAAYYGLDKSDEFKEFKDKYIKVTTQISIQDVNVDAVTIAYGKKHSIAVKDFLEKAPEDARNVWNTIADADGIHVIDSKYKGGANFNRMSNGVYINIADVAKGSSYQTPYQCFFHEHGHEIDYELNMLFGNKIRNRTISEVYKKGKLGKTIKKEAETAIKNFMIDMEYDTDIIDEDIVRDFCKHMKLKLTMMQRTDISDMFESYTQAYNVEFPFDIGHGHYKDGSSYWSNRDNGKEAFAEMYSAEIANSESLEAIKKYFPESYKVFKEILGVIK